MSKDSACDHASTGSRAEAHTPLPHAACQNSVHTRHVTVESACGSIDGAHALRTVSRQHTPGDGVCVSVEARAGISNSSTTRQPLLSNSSLPRGIRDSSFAASPRRQWRVARRVVIKPTVRPWRARACAVAVVVVALCFAGGMYAYDRFFVTPPVGWTKTTPAAAAHQCPYFNASVRDCHTPPPPSVVATAPWTAQLCWPRCPSFSWYEVDMDDWWSNHPMEFVPAYWYGEMVRHTADVIVLTASVRRGNATSCTVTNLLPASTYHVRVRMWTAPNASHSNYSATATIHTDTLGHCGNTNDVQVLARQRASTRASIVSCFEVRALWQVVLCGSLLYAASAGLHAGTPAGAMYHALHLGACGTQHSVFTLLVQ